ncbi:hypothetical protein RJ640_010579 [Escallonia rubra]|uniref:pectinesterase n=1 Tax=Escallonia rubra TaxID=112253 RepID=A0AA88QX41_9ASTE|nr:hypothetical protein RJ640_010579 [Escallonia rubra]
MESINLVKGYNKVDPLEDDISRLPTTPQNRRITVVVSLTLLLSVAIGGMIGALIHESATDPSESSPSLSANSAESLRSICSVTRYPESCFSSISSINTMSNCPKPHPELVLNLSLRVALTELTNLASLPRTLISKSNDAGAVSALNDCASLLGDAVSQLNNSASLLGGEKAALTEDKISDMKTWISAAMTDQDTCVDGLEETASTVVDEVKGKVQRSTEYMSNSLAILANINALLDKFGLKMH